MIFFTESLGELKFFPVNAVSHDNLLRILSDMTLKVVWATLREKPFWPVHF